MLRVNQLAGFGGRKSAVDLEPFVVLRARMANPLGSPVFQDIQVNLAGSTVSSFGGELVNDGADKIRFPDNTGAMRSQHFGGGNFGCGFTYVDEYHEYLTGDYTTHLSFNSSVVGTKTRLYVVYDSTTQVVTYSFGVESGEFYIEGNGIPGFTAYSSGAGITANVWNDLAVIFKGTDTIVGLNGSPIATIAGRPSDAVALNTPFMVVGSPVFPASGAIIYLNEFQITRAAWPIQPLTAHFGE